MMSKYTTELRYPLEQRFSEKRPDYYGNPDPYTVCQEARDVIFDFYYPINAEDKERFEINFLLHYYTREIGSETLALFKLRLQSRLNELIPKYNMLWNQLDEMSRINLYGNVDLETVRRYGHTITRTGNTSHEYENFQDKTVTNRTGKDTGTLSYEGAENRSSRVTERVSDTPMGTIDNMDTVENNMYLSGAKITETEAPTTFKDRKNTNETVYGSGTTSIRTPTGKEKEVYNDIADRHGGTDTETVKGKNGGKSYTEEMLKARDLFINIDQMLIRDLRNLFMLVW